MTRSENELTFEKALARLKELVEAVKKKETSLDESLELLEEGVRLVNFCTEKIDVLREEGEMKKQEEEEGRGESKVPEG